MSGLSVYTTPHQQRLLLKKARDFRERNIPARIEHRLPDDGLGSEFVDARLKRGLSGALSWQKALHDGTEKEQTVVYGEPADVQRPRLNTIGLLHGFAGDDEFLSQDEFVSAFSLHSLNEKEVDEVMAGVDRVDGYINSSSVKDKKVSIRDAMPFVGWFDAGGESPLRTTQGLNMKISPAERQSSVKKLKKLAQSPEEVDKWSSFLRTMYKSLYRTE